MTDCVPPPDCGDIYEQIDDGRDRAITTIAQRAVDDAAGLQHSHVSAAPSSDSLVLVTLVVDQHAARTMSLRVIHTYV